MQTKRLKARYNKLQDWYAQEITSLKRSPEHAINRPEERMFNLAEQKQTGLELAEHLKLKPGWDIPLLFLKLMANFDYARDNKNPYLMRESLHGFPIMNYTLNEGPFKVTKDAVFGPEDYHVILQGDDGNLIYFTPEQHGLKKGLFVECTL